MINKKTFWRPPLAGTCGVIAAFILAAVGCASGPPPSTQGAAPAGGSTGKDSPVKAVSLEAFAPILQAHPNGVMANRDGERLRTQIITFQFYEGNRAYFCTNSEKPFYAQLVDSPFVSYCTFPDDFEPVVSLNGPVVFVEDQALKARALQGNPYVKRNFGTPDNPVFKLFYIDIEEIETYGADGAKRYPLK